MATTFAVTGLKELSARLTKLGLRVPSVVGGALYREAERIMAEAKVRTPVATGALQEILARRRGA